MTVNNASVYIRTCCCGLGDGLRSSNHMCQVSVPPFSALHVSTGRKSRRPAQEEEVGQNDVEAAKAAEAAVVNQQHDEEGLVILVYSPLYKDGHSPRAIFAA